MEGIVNLREKVTYLNDLGRIVTEISFAIYYEDGQIFSTEIILHKENPSLKETMDAIGKYFKGDLQYSYARVNG